jgi:hypothetical protein
MRLILIFLTDITVYAGIPNATHNDVEAAASTPQPIRPIAIWC